MLSLIRSRSVVQDLTSRIRGSFAKHSAGRRSSVAMSTTASVDPAPVARVDMPYLHHGTRPRFRGKPKFKSPRKRASSLYQEIVQEAMHTTRESNPKVHDVHFRVGDAIEIIKVSQGGVKSSMYEKYRGVVIGKFNKKLDTTVLIRDVLFGFPVERRIPLYSPLIRSIKVLEENFVFKGKRKVKRAKLYYLRDRNPNETRVTKG